ncbi:MAG: hypothetical protein ACRDHL_12285, partial [Candidatus Promineifilaceae bacterium]
MSGRRPLALLLALFAGLALGYSLLMPLWEAPDETAHYLYALILARQGRPPTFDETYEALQPPAYYALAAVALRGLDALDPALAEPYRPPLAGRDAPLRYAWDAGNYRFIWGAYLLRWLNIPLGMLAVAAIYLGARKALEPGSGGAPMAAAALVALLPQFLHNTVTVGNDALANLAGALLFWLLVAIGRGAGRPGWLWPAGLVALALPFLIKLTLLPLALGLA